MPQQPAGVDDDDAVADPLELSEQVRGHDHRDAELRADPPDQLEHVVAAGGVERVCREIVVIDAGRLLRHSTTAAVTAETPVVAVEVDDDPADLLDRLRVAGVTAQAVDRLIQVDVADPSTYDLVRDAVAELGLGLVRMERQRHRMTEIFADRETEQGGVGV